ncbi:hypothetical protein Sjap_020298 [Stephania japonica]|uniref:DYW domain-containing protein n=1 Tax=Stephania japonica TaxID=461633 RepID=A0AAP0F9D1_9MAGN
MSFSNFILSCSHSPRLPLLPLQTHLLKSTHSPNKPTLPSSFAHTTSLQNPSPTDPQQQFLSWVLSFCNTKSLKHGVCVHTPIIKLGLQHHLFLNNNLLSLYSKCFGTECARHLFDEMPHRDVVSWTGMMSAYVRDGRYMDVLDLFVHMLASGLGPNEFTFSTFLRACSSLREFEQGVCAQGQITKLGFDSNWVVGSALIDFYSKCDCFADSLKVFEAMNNGDTVSWTTMISCSVRAQDWVLALRLYFRMVRAGIGPNEFTFVKLLIACAFLGLKYGKMVHAHVIAWGAKLNLVLKTALVDMYSKCQRMVDAVKVSNQTPESDVMLWTSMINGYTQVLDFKGAVDVFKKMELAGSSPNSFTYAGILDTCSSIPQLELGKQIHSQVIKSGLEWDVSVGNGLVNMYMNCSRTVEDSLKAFEEVISPNVISWTSLIVGFTQHGLEDEAFQVISEMRTNGMEPNSITLTVLLKSCSMFEDSSRIEVVHAYIVKTNTFSDSTVNNALVDAYARSGMMDDARNAINSMSHRDAITYTSLATGFNQTGRYEKTLGIIQLMMDDNIKIDDFSMASFLSASASLAAIVPGRQLHCYSVKSGLGSWISVVNGLVDLYGKCGIVQDAYKVFIEIFKPNVVSWNGLIAGFASNGHFSSALSCFEDMILAGIQPDQVTFVLLLYACSHGNLIDQGVEYFHSMNKAHNIAPQLDHYVCLVDLLGRAGRLEEAVHVIETMPFKPDALIYKTLLGSCKIHKNVTLGEDMANKALELNSLDPAVYILLANIYDEARRSDLGESMRKMMREKGLKKNPGQSWMEIRSKVHLFCSGDRSHERINDIHEKLALLKQGLKSMRYEYEEEPGSSYHSEKLAIAFGLLSLPSMAPIRIIKNLRICRDCHMFAMLVSKLVDREIVVRDGNRFHSFKNGQCSCQGYW